MQCATSEKQWRHLNEARYTHKLHVIVSASPNPGPPVQLEDLTLARSKKQASSGSRSLNIDHQLVSLASAEQIWSRLKFKHLGNLAKGKERTRYSGSLQNSPKATPKPRSAWGDFNIPTEEDNNNSGPLKIRKEVKVSPFSATSNKELTNLHKELLGARIRSRKFSADDKSLRASSTDGVNINSNNGNSADFRSQRLLERALLLQKTLRHDASEKQLTIPDVRGEGSVALQQSSSSPQKRPVLSKMSSPCTTFAATTGRKTFAFATGNLYASKSPKKNRGRYLSNTARSNEEPFRTLHTKTDMKSHRQDTDSPVKISRQNPKARDDGTFVMKRYSLQPQSETRPTLRRKTRLNIDLAVLQNKAEKRPLLLEKRYGCKRGIGEKEMPKRTLKFPEAESNSSKIRGFGNAKFGSVREATSKKAYGKRKMGTRKEKDKSKKEVANKRPEKRESKDGGLINVNYLKLAVKLAEEINKLTPDRRGGQMKGCK